MEPFFLHYLTFWRPIGYAIIFIGMIFEGEIVLFSAAFLTHQGFFHFGNTILLVASGVFIGDLFWYKLGTILGKRATLINKWSENLTKSFDDRIQKKLSWTLFITKFAYGIHHAILVRAGMLGVEFKYFLESDIPASIVWIFVVGGLGYFSSASLSGTRHLRFIRIALNLG